MSGVVMSIKKILNNCCGCTVCKNICPYGAIKMITDDKDFIFPMVDEKCVDCGLCEKFCPQVTSKLNKNDEQNYYAVKRKDISLRLQSQSGGAFSAFAEYVLANSGVVYGVLLNNKLEAEYARVEKISQLKKLKGSKYVQAKIGNVFIQVQRDLCCNKCVLFSGTPCHVHGLLQYLLVKKVKTEKLITIDLICHGVASPLIYNNYKHFFSEFHKKKIIGFDFRNKEFLENGSICKIITSDGSYLSKDYVKIYESDYALRDCCFECNYANLQRVGDISIGDCWGIERKNEEFNDNKGCSFVILNNAKGKKLFINSRDEFEYINVDIGDFLQRNLKMPTSIPPLMIDFWDDYKKYGFNYVSYKYCGVNPQMDYMINKKSNTFEKIKKLIINFFYKRIQK